MYCFKNFISFCCAFISLLIIPGQLQAQVYAKNGMVVSASDLASENGTQILKAGGNAVDAAVATAFSLAVTWPWAGNIGGGGFMVIRLEDGQVTTIDAREKAPLASTAGMFLDAEENLKSGINHNTALAIGVPGTVAGLYKAHQLYGKLPWDQLVQPAIVLAEEGFPLTYRIAKDFKNFAKEAEKYPEMQAFIRNDKGEVVQFGETWKQTALANTLKIIQEKGPKGFYEGFVAEKMVEYIQKMDGIITQEDLKRYEAIERTPVHTEFREYHLYGMPLPSSGGLAVSQMFKMFDQLKETPDFASVEYYHYLAEIMRRAFADRAVYMGDPDFLNHTFIDSLLTDNYAAKLVASINPEKATPIDSTYTGHFNEGNETTHFSILDKKGMAVSMTFTLEHGYGVKMYAPEIGFLLNNEMGDFNAVPGITTSGGQNGSVANQIAPEKRMLSSMSPFIVTKDEQVYMVIGSPGGRTIINTVFQSILAATVYEMPIDKSIETSKIHHQWLPNRIIYEKYLMEPATQQALGAMGHTLIERANMGRLMGIIYDMETGLITGAADSASPDGGVAAY